MNEITNNIAKALRDPLKYIAAPIIYLLYSSTLILYGYLIQPWMVNKAHKEISITHFFNRANGTSIKIVSQRIDYCIAYKMQNHLMNGKVEQETWTGTIES